ncbi:MAG: hypothetical protein U0075_23590 [Thermomicrobiales bacterium]
MTQAPCTASSNGRVFGGGAESPTAQPGTSTSNLAASGGLLRLLAVLVDIARTQSVQQTGGTS